MALTLFRPARRQMNDKLRILALNWRCLRHPQAGGSEINLFEQARRWARDGHDVTVICSDPGREYAPTTEEIDAGVLIRRMGGRLTLYLKAALFLLKHGQRYDVVFDVANGIPFFSPMFTNTQSVLLVHHVHDRQRFIEFPALFASIGWFIEQKVVPRLYWRNPVIAVSPTTRDALIKTGVSESQVTIIYNGTDLPDREIDDQSVMNSTNTARWRNHRIAYVGRLKKYKRVELLLRAVANLRSEFPDIHLDIAGDGDAKPDIQREIDELGLQNCVTLHGFVDQATKSEILRNAAVFAMPSMHEGWGLSVIEANSHGCPAVTYDVPGLRVAVKHGVTGLLADDDESFERAIAILLSDVSLRQEYSQAALSWAKKFDWNTCAAETLEVLKNCVTPDRSSKARKEDSRRVA